MTDAMSVATRASLDDPEANEGASTSAVSALLGDRASAKASRWARRAKERLEESRDRLRRVIEGEWDLKTTLAHRERKAVAGALASSLGRTATTTTRFRISSAGSSSTPSGWTRIPPGGVAARDAAATTVDEQIQRTTTAAGTFVGALAVAESLPGDDDPTEDDHDPTERSDFGDPANTAVDDGNSRVNSVAGRLRERWTDVIGALMIAAVAAKRYDARCAAALRRLSVAAGVRWSRVAALEDSLALHLKSILRSQRGAEGVPRGAGGVPRVRRRRDVPVQRRVAKHSGGGQTQTTDGWLSQPGTCSRALSVTAAAAVGGSVLFITGVSPRPRWWRRSRPWAPRAGYQAPRPSVGTLLAYFGGAAGYR